MDKELQEIKRDLKAAIQSLMVALDRRQRFVKRTGKDMGSPKVWEFLRSQASYAMLVLNVDGIEIGPFRFKRNNKAAKEDSP
jgi:hypothetical protein